MSRLPLDGKSPVEAVIHDMHSRKGQLRADLVRHPRVDRHLKQCTFLVSTPRQANGVEIRDCMERSGLDALPSTRDVNHTAERERRVMHQIVLKRASYSHGPLDQRQICLLHRLFGELRAETLICDGGPGNQDKSLVK